jgi:hypothetical protein
VINIGYPSRKGVIIIPIGPWDRRAIPGQGPRKGYITRGGHRYEALYLPEERKQDEPGEKG